ncbi:MAG: preprotein translocase subunit SecG [Candidatus Gottesmanbacteria bacterium]
MKILLLIIQFIISFILIGLILVQNSKGGLTAGVGGGAYRTKRGAEKVIFSATIISAIIFLIISIINLLAK